MDNDDDWEDEPVAGPSGKGGGQETSSYQILPIAELPDDFDGNPVDGAQYLAMMHKMYKDLPFITSAPRPPSKTTAQSQPVLRVPDTFTGTVKERHSALPKESWELSFTTHFVEYKKAVMSQPPAAVGSALLPPSDQSGFASYIYGAKRKKQHVSQIKSATVDGEAVAATAKPVPVPLVTEEEEEMMMNDMGLHPPASGAEIVGEEGWEDEGVEGEEMGEDAVEEVVLSAVDDATIVDPRESTGASSASFMFEPEQPKHRSKEPLMSVVRAMPQRTIVKALKHFDTWISRALELAEEPANFISTQPASEGVKSGPSPNVSSAISLPFPSFNTRWIFALLLCLDNELHPDDMSDLRQLARTCMSVVRWQVLNGKLIAPVEPEQEEMRMGCWMIVYAISAAWAQRDLTEDAERIFAKLPR